MAVEIPDTFEADVMPDKFKLSTKNAHDCIRIDCLSLNSDQAAALSYLINQESELNIEIKIKE